MSTYIQSSINTATLINASEKRRQTRTAQTLPSKAKVKEEILSRSLNILKQYQLTNSSSRLSYVVEELKVQPSPTALLRPVGEIRLWCLSRSDLHHVKSTFFEQNLELWQLTLILPPHFVNQGFIRWHLTRARAGFLLWCHKHFFLCQILNFWWLISSSVTQHFAFFCYYYTLP